MPDFVKCPGCGTQTTTQLLASQGVCDICKAYGRKPPAPAKDPDPVIRIPESVRLKTGPLIGALVTVVVAVPLVVYCARVYLQAAVVQQTAKEVRDTFSPPAPPWNTAPPAAGGDANAMPSTDVEAHLGEYHMEGPVRTYDGPAWRVFGTIINDGNAPATDATLEVNLYSGLHLVGTDRFTVDGVPAHGHAGFQNSIVVQSQVSPDRSEVLLQSTTPANRIVSRLPSGPAVSP